MTRNLDSIYAAAGKPLYIEQLLYMDSTEAFSHNTQVEDEQVGEFVRNLAPVLSGRTNGYGLWAVSYTHLKRKSQKSYRPNES